MITPTLHSASAEFIQKIFCYRLISQLVWRMDQTGCRRQRIKDTNSIKGEHCLFYCMCISSSYLSSFFLLIIETHVQEERNSLMLRVSVDVKAQFLYGFAPHFLVHALFDDEVRPYTAPWPSHPFFPYIPTSQSISNFPCYGHEVLLFFYILNESWNILTMSLSILFHVPVADFWGLYDGVVNRECNVSCIMPSFSLLFPARCPPEDKNQNTLISTCRFFFAE